MAGAGYKSVGFTYGEPTEDPEVQDIGGVPPEPASAPAEFTESFQPPYSIPDELQDRMVSGGLQKWSFPATCFLTEVFLPLSSDNERLDNKPDVDF